MPAAVTADLLREAAYDSAALTRPDSTPLDHAVNGADLVDSPSPLPFSEPTVVIAAPGEGPGNWAGAASAVLHDGTFWLAYRLRRPLDAGRGVKVVVARSDDGVRFDPVCTLDRQTFGAASFERPALIAIPGGGWRLYLSCATPGSKHWWIEAVDAATPADLPSGQRTVVLPGSDEVAVKDPVVVVDDSGWQMWVCCHPLTEVGDEDRMSTAYATSDDGLDWVVHDTVLRGSEGRWDARGTRVTAVVETDPLTVLYDGRPDAARNWHEQTGVARSANGNGRLRPLGDAPVGVSPHSDGSLRYVSAVPLGGGRTRYYYEVARPDGAHDLVTALR